MVLPVAEIQAAAIQGTNVRQEFFYVGKPGQRAHQIGVGAESHGVLIGTDFEVPAHAGGEVDDDVGARAADAVDYLTVEFHVTAAPACFGVTDVTVRDGGACFGSVDGGIRDFLWGDRDRGVLACGVSGTSHRTAYKYFEIHFDVLLWAMGAYATG